MKNLIFLLLPLLVTFTSTAQLAQTRAEIIEKYGYDYKTGTTDGDATPFIYYEKMFTTDASGTYKQTEAMYFFTTTEGVKLCYLWRLIEPDTETNNNVIYLNSKYVKRKTMEWKDYRTGAVYSMKVEDGLCVISAWLETED